MPEWLCVRREKNHRNRVAPLRSEAENLPPQTAEGRREKFSELPKSQRPPRPSPEFEPDRAFPAAPRGTGRPETRDKEDIGPKKLPLLSKSAHRGIGSSVQLTEQRNGLKS